MPPVKGPGPFVEFLKTNELLFDFNEEEKKQIEEKKDDMAVVRGVRRQVACSLLNLMK